MRPEEGAHERRGELMEHAQARHKGTFQNISAKPALLACVAGRGIHAYRDVVRSVNLKRRGTPTRSKKTLLEKAHRTVKDRTRREAATDDAGEAS